MVDKKGTPVFVTACNEQYARCLYQLLLSAERRHAVGLGTWFAFDIGMQTPTRQDLETRFPWCEIRAFDFTVHPKHLELEHRNYAWKPYIIWDVVQSATGPVLWLDSATVIKRDMRPILDEITERGIFAVRGQAPMIERCEQSTMVALDFPRGLWGSKELNASVVGFDPDHPTARKIAQDWKKFAADPEIIRPSNVSLPRHMNDQALLSCLVLKQMYSGGLDLDPADIDISSPDPLKTLSSRNKVWARTPIWQDALVRARYAVGKFFDLWSIRIDRWIRRNNCQQRWRTSRSFVNFRMAGEDQKTRIGNPLGGWYGTPSVVQFNGKTIIFASLYSIFRRRAYLAAIEIDNGKVGRRRIVINGDAPASFPGTFRHNGALFVVAEAPSSQSFDLYQCLDFPTQWQRKRSILRDLDAVGAVIFQHGSLWWLFTSLNSADSGEDYRYLAIYYSDDPVKGDWIGHSVNDQGLYIDRKPPFGRGAGPVLQRDGKLYRPVQGAPGEGIKIMEIIYLTKTEFQEIPAIVPTAIAGEQVSGPVSHITEVESLTAWQTDI